MSNYVEGSKNLDHQSAIDDPPQHGVSGDDLSFGDTVQRAVGAAREAVDAELSLVRLRAGIMGGAAQWIAILGVIALIICFGMIVTLMIGAVLALAPHWGLGIALLFVTGGALVAIALCGLGIRAQIARIKGAFP